MPTSFIRLKQISPACLLFIILASCSSKSNRDFMILNELNSGLEMSNRIIGKTNERMYNELENKYYNPGTAYKAQTWVPKSKSVYERTNELYSYIDELKSELKNQSSIEEGDSKKTYKGDDKQVVKNLFINQKKGNELKNKMMAYRVRLLCCDSTISKEFDEMVTSVTQKFDTSDLEKDFSGFFSKNINVSEALFLLTKLQNNIRLAENRLISFCNSQVVDNRFVIEACYQYAVIIGQSNSIVMPQETIVITSGMGSFTKNPDPFFLINGREIKVNDYNQAVYKFKASSKPGKHFVPVSISYTDQDGKKRTIEQRIEYTVSNCGN